MICNPGPVKSVLFLKDMGEAPLDSGRRKHRGRCLGMRANVAQAIAVYFEVLKDGKPKNDGILLVIRALPDDGSPCCLGIKHLEENLHTAVGAFGVALGRRGQDIAAAANHTTGRLCCPRDRLLFE